MQNWLLVAGVALLAAGCAPLTSKPAEEPKPNMQPERLPAPTPADAAVRILAEDAGKTIEVSVGQKVSVALVGVPTAGYLWAVAEQPAFLSAPVEGGGPTSEAQKQPGFAGGNHWEVFTFTVNGAGQGIVRLEQRRPWEKTEPPSQTFEVTIRAR